MSNTATTTPARPRFTIVVQPINDERPDAVRLRRLLKDLGRRHGLRVIDVAERHAPAVDRLEDK